MKRLALSVFSIMSASATLASAEPPDAPAADRIEARAKAPGAFEHDGFYLRFGLGFGAFAQGLSSKDENAADDNSQGTISGVSTVGELMIGGTVTRSLILGGGVWTSTVLVSDFDQTNGDTVPGDLREPDNFTVVGPFVDWYFGHQALRRGDGGLHAQGGLGLAVLNGFRPEQFQGDDRRVAVGPGVMLGFGYEWWVDEQWGMGVLGRLTAAGLIEEDERDDIWYHGVATFPAVLFAGTYN